jgi:ribosomal-protein-alanine N-acetyltransferase
VSCCGYRKRPTTPIGPRCAKEAATSSRLGSQPGPRYSEDLRTDQGYAFLIIRSSDNALVGGLTLANIRRGVAQAGSIGYWMGRPFVRQGYMTAAVRAIIPFAFTSLRLHRLEAACIPTNAGSIRLLEKTGFVREGYAREYLCINGIWQDHLLYGRLKDSKP